MNIPKIFYQAWEGDYQILLIKKKCSSYKLFSLDDIKNYLDKN
jgi:hypothetical protein